MSGHHRKTTYGTLPFAHVGPATARLAQFILYSGEKRSLERVELLFSYGEIFSLQRLEAACRRALHYGRIDTSSVLDILERGLDAFPLNPETDIEGQYTFDIESP